MIAARPDFGRSLVGLMIVMVTLAGMGAAALAESRGGSGGGHHGLSIAPVLGLNPGAAATDLAGGAQAACRADFQAAEQAEALFRSLQGHAPAALTDIAQYLKGPLASPRFAVSVGPGGQIEVAAGGHPAAPGDANCAYAP